MTEAEDRISQRIDKSVTSVVPVTKSQAAGLSMETLAQVMEFAKLMAISDVAVPKYLRGNPGACLAIATQALEWRMSPFSVANKSYNVNDRIAYEAQLINAVVLSRAPIKGRFEVKYEGAGDHRVCIVSVQPKVGERIEHASPPREKITPKNSPLWKSDPDQQQFYYTSRALCRRYFPDVLLGVYADDELPTIDVMSEKVPRVEAPRDLSDRLDALVDDGADYSSGDEHASGGTGETIDQGGPLSSPGAEVSSHADATPSASDRPPGTQPQPPSEAPGGSPGKRKRDKEPDLLAPSLSERGLALANKGSKPLEDWIATMPADDMARVSLAQMTEWRNIAKQVQDGANP